MSFSNINGLRQTCETRVKFFKNPPNEEEL